MQLIFQVKQLLSFALQHLAYRYARPAGNYIGDVFSRYLFLNQGTVTLLLLQVFLDRLDFILQCLKLSVADFSHPSVITFTLCLVGFELQLFDFLLVLLNLVHQFFLTLPFSLVRSLLFLQFCNLLVQLSQFSLVLFTLDSLTFNFDLLQPTFDFIQFFWKRITLHTQFGSRFIHQVDGLIRQETVGNVTVAQFHCRDDGFVFDTHLMVVLVTLLQSTQDGDRAGRIRFVYHNCLETTFQCLILFEILLVFIEGSGTDAPQFTTGQGRFQNVGGIHGTFPFSGTHQRVDFIDKEDDVSVGLRHFVDNRFQTFLKFTFVFGTCNQRTHIQ